MADKQRQPAVFKHRLAVADFARDIDIDQQLGLKLEPVFRDQPGVLGRVAGDDRNSANIGDVKVELRQRDRIVGLAQIRAQRLCDLVGCSKFSFCM